MAAETGTRVNRLAPVDRLADETLVLILLRLDSRTTFFSTKVSRRWRNISLSNPSLWAHVDLSCCSNFQRRFQLFVDRSHKMPLDLKLVMESTEIDISDIPEDDEEALSEFFSEQCDDDLSEQLGDCIQSLALAPNVVARLRVLDITSKLTTDPNEYGPGKIKQPTPTLRLPASSSLQRLRLNWAQPDVHELHLDLGFECGTYDSITSLALCAVDNLREVLPCFPYVVDLSLWLGEPQESTPQDIQLAEICEWMVQLRKLEVVEVPIDFASKAPAVPPTLDRLVLHGRFARDVVVAFASLMNLNSIAEISLWDNKGDTFKPSIVSMPSGPAMELSVHGFQRWSQPELGYHFCAENCRGLRRIFHSTLYYYESKCNEEIIDYATINTNMEAFYDVVPKAMPQLTTLRIRMDSDFQSDSHRVSQISCPALAHLELYVTATASPDKNVTSGAHVMDWIAKHLKDFSRPLETLRVVGVRSRFDVGALNSLAHAVFLNPTSLFEYVSFHHWKTCSQNIVGKGRDLIRRWLLRCSISCG